ncbi:MAG: hypothetical protein HQ596_07170 [Candidatus Saganbacteria bacterium]|nr:hypothetical protein [Candidatus Saganbacteria bacterium]
MLKYLSLILITVLVIEIPAIGAASTQVWSKEVLLDKDIVIPSNQTLIIKPGTKINCIYEYKDQNYSPTEWKIIVKGKLIAEGDKNNPIIIDPMPLGLSSIKIPTDSKIKTIIIAPQQIDTQQIKNEFRTFRIQYLALWTLLFAGIYYAIIIRGS